MKPPKNIAKYDSSLMAGMKLMHLALERIFGCKDGVKIRWSISISYWHDDWADPEKSKGWGPAIGTQSSFSNQ